MTFKNSEAGELLRKEFATPQFPKKPIKRELTDEEIKIMYKHFNNHSWSNIDADGKIILGGGEEDCGSYYITEEDLKQLQ